MNQSTDKRAQDRTVLLQRGSELAEFEDLLTEFGVRFESHSDGLPTLAELEGVRLVVVVGKRLLENGTPNLGLWPRTIAVADDASRTLVSQLNRIGVSTVIRRPIHPRALRLLLLHEIYRGPEKRGRKRTLIGHPIRVGAGLFKSKATLLELSPTGARIEMTSTPKVGSRLWILFGKELTHAKPLKLQATVVRCIRSTTGRNRSQCEVGVSIARSSAEVIKIKGILDRFAMGPASWKSVRRTPDAPPNRVSSALQERVVTEPTRALPENRELAPSSNFELEIQDSGADVPSPPGTCSTEIPPCALAHDDSVLGESVDETIAASDGGEEVHDPRERRGTTRVPYDRRVVALGEEAARVLVGRDLSPGGMRIDATSSVALGDQLRVALHSGNRSEPVIVLANVLRDDGEDGLILAFTDLSPRQQDQLDQIIDCSGPIHVNQDASDDEDGSRRPGGTVIVAEMLARDVGQSDLRAGTEIDSFVDASESVEDTW